MRCDTCNELICLFIDGELDAERQSDLFMHLGECAECRSFLHGLLRIREIQQSEQITYPAEIDRVVLDAKSTRKPARVVSLWRKSISLPVPVAIAAVLLIVAIGVLTLSQVIPGEQVRRQSTSNTYVQADIPTPNVIYVLPEVTVIADSSTVSSSESGK